MYWYSSRWYDPALNHFVQPDTIIPEPGKAIGYDRFAYANNNPIRYTDPTGHYVDDGCTTEGCSGNPNAIVHSIYMGGFTGILPPNNPEILSTLAEETHIPGGQGPANPYADMIKSKTRPDDPYLTPLVGGLVALGDLAVQPLIYGSYKGKNRINVFLNYEETTDGDMQITSLDIWNNTNNHVNVVTAGIETNPIRHCYTEACLSVARNSYRINRAGISSPEYQGVGLGLSVPQSFSNISLLGSSKNPYNHVYSNSMVNVQA